MRHAVQHRCGCMADVRLKCFWSAVPHRCLRSIISARRAGRIPWCPCHHSGGSPSTLAARAAMAVAPLLAVRQAPPPRFRAKVDGSIASDVVVQGSSVAASSHVGVASSIAAASQSPKTPNFKSPPSMLGRAPRPVQAKAPPQSLGAPPPKTQRTRAPTLDIGGAQGFRPQGAVAALSQAAAATPSMATTSQPPTEPAYIVAPPPPFQPPRWMDP